MDKPYIYWEYEDFEGTERILKTIEVGVISDYTRDYYAENF